MKSLTKLLSSFSIGRPRVSQRNDAADVQFIRPHHNVVVCGSSQYKQLGTKTTKDGKQEDPPEPLQLMDCSKIHSPIIQVCCGCYHTLLLTENGQVWGVGFNGENQLGEDTQQEFNEPIQIQLPLDARVVKCFAVGDFNVYLTNDHRVLVHGANGWGQLGLGHKHKVSKPIYVQGLRGKKIKDVEPGYGHVYYQLDNDDIYSVGANTYAQIAHGFVSSEDLNLCKIQMPHGIEKFKKVISGNAYAFFLTYNGKAYAVGGNTYGQLGIANSNKSCVEITHVSALDHKNIIKISCGQFFTIFLTDDHQLYSVGRNQFYQLGLGNNIDQHVPQQIQLDQQFKFLWFECGFNHTVFLTSDGELYGMGLNTNLQLGLSSTVKEVKYLTKLSPYLKNNNFITERRDANISENVSRVFTGKEEIRGY